MIDLTRWNLTIPIGAKVISTQTLNAGYADAYFIRNPDGSLTFRAPSDEEGVKSTPNSTYPRSELRETLVNGDDKEANWPLTSAPCHLLRAELRIDSLASDGKAIIGQAHGETNHPPIKVNANVNDDNPELIDIMMQLRKKLDGTEDKPIFFQAKLGEWFAYELQVLSDGKLYVYTGPDLAHLTEARDVTGKVNLNGYQFDAASYKSDTWYWKAGMYSQTVVGGKGTGQATYRVIQAVAGDRPVQPGIPVVTPPVVVPPVVVPPVVVPPPVVTPPAARTLANVSADVAAQLNIWRVDHGQVKAVEAAIQVLKTEADTFPKGDERSAVYTAITAARTEIRAVPPVVVDPPVDNSLSGQIATIVKANAAGTMTLSAAKAKLNTIGDQIDEMDDGAEQTALYAQLKAATTGLK